MKHPTDMKARWNDRAREDAFYFIETHFWNGDVDAFFALGEERTALLVDTMLERAGRRPEGLVVLDVGCGVGRFTRALAGRFREAIGVDVSDEMIARAAEFNPPDRHPNLSFRVGDGSTLPVDSAGVDVVFCYEVLQHLPSLDVIAANLREVRRVLRGDGIGYLHFPVEDRAVFHIPFARHGYERLRHLKHSVLRNDPSMTDETFRGVPPLSTNGVRTLCADASLDVVEVVADETNPPGTCVFFRVRPAA